MIRLNVNGSVHDIDAAPDTALLYVLRNDLEPGRTHLVAQQCVCRIAFGISSPLGLRRIANRRAIDSGRLRYSQNQMVSQKRRCVRKV